MNCTVCHRDPKRMNSERAECSHVDCPHRRRCWSERPTGHEHYRGAWPVNIDADPKPLDEELK